MKITNIIAATAIAASSFLLTIPSVSAHDGHDITKEAKAAVANSNRPESEVARDGARKPAEVLSFYGVKPGMTVLDMFSSGGYYTAVISNLVGENGKVYAHNSPNGKDRRGEALAEKYKAFPNVELKWTAPAEQDLPDASVDAVFIVLIYHHLHYSEADGEMTPASTKTLLAEVKRVLKPGGVFGVIEHTAAAGSSRVESASWHRTPAQTAIDDITAAGFEYAGSASIHVNAEDDLKNYWRPAGLSGKTTRFVQKYIKK
jgi:predicted methyltransferase